MKNYSAATFQSWLQKSELKMSCKQDLHLKACLFVQIDTNHKMFCWVINTKHQLTIEAKHHSVSQKKTSSKLRDRHINFCTKMFTFLYLILKWVLLESCALWTIWSKHPDTQQRIRKEIHFFLSTVLFGLDWMHPWSSAAIIAVVKVLIQEAKWKGYWQKKLWWAHTKTHTHTSCLDEVSLMTTDWKRRKKKCV